MRKISVLMLLFVASTTSTGLADESNTESFNQDIGSGFDYPVPESKIPNMGSKEKSNSSESNLQPPIQEKKKSKKGRSKKKSGPDENLPVIQKS